MDKISEVKIFEIYHIHLFQILEGNRKLNRNKIDTTKSKTKDFLTHIE